MTIPQLRRIYDRVENQKKVIGQRIQNEPEVSEPLQDKFIRTYQFSFRLREEFLRRMHENVRRADLTPIPDKVRPDVLKFLSSGKNMDEAPLARGTSPIPSFIAETSQFLEDKEVA